MYNHLRNYNLKTIGASAVAPDGTIYVGSGSKIYKSTNYGRSFTEVYTVPGNPMYIRTIFIDSNGYVFASGFKGISNYGIFRSIDNGQNWTEVLVLNEKCCIWRMAEKNGNLVAANYSFGDCTEHEARLYKSADGGANWTQVYYDPNGRHMHGVWYDPYNGCFYATQGENGAQARMLRSSDGKTWKILKQDGLYAHTSFVCTTNYRIWGGDDPKIRRTSDDIHFEVVWENPGDYKGPFFWARKTDDGVIYFSMITNGASLIPAHAAIFKTYDEGDSWAIVKDWGSINASWKGSSFASNVAPDGTIFISDNIIRLSTILNPRYMLNFLLETRLRPIHLKQFLRLLMEKALF